MAYWPNNPLLRQVNFSREVEAASKALDTAKEELCAALATAYPLGAAVRVVHYRGEFTGTVNGFNSNGPTISVRNSKSGKSAHWFAGLVELEGQPNG